MRDWHAYVRERLHLHAVKPDREQDVIDDLAVLLDEAHRDAVARGLSEVDAVAAAEAHITDWDGLSRQVAQSRRLRLPTLARLETRSADAAVDGDRHAGLLTGLLQDLRFAVRLKRHRGYFAFATGTLAVAVGVNLIVFTIVNALWLRPLPFKDPDRLVALTGKAWIGVSGGIFQSFEATAGQTVIDRSINAVSSNLQPQLAFDLVGRELETIGVTPGFFPLLGLHVRGRDFTEDDDRVGAEPVAIISDRLWSREFGRRADVIGSVAGATPMPIRIIGVAPPGFEGAQRGDKADVWIPRRLMPRVAASPGSLPLADDTLVRLQPFARLRPGDSPATLMQQWIDDGTNPIELDGLAIVPMKDVFGTPYSSAIVVREDNAFSVVAGLAMLVLLGGCATLTALVLVHYERRRRDQAVKIALGASRTRLTRELSLELALLAVSGTAGAVLVATWGLGAIPSLSLPGGVNLGRLDLSMDWRVFAVAVGTTVLTLVVAAWLPVSRFTRARLAGELIAGPATTASASSHRMRQVLLSLHVSATIVVLIAAGLFVRAVVHGFGTAPGFDADHMVFVNMSIRGPAPAAFQSPQAWLAAAAERNARLQDALRALPGVDAVAVGGSPIMTQSASPLVGPRVVEAGGESHELRIGAPFEGPDWLATLGVPILAGRGLTSDDEGMRPAPAVVTASLARRLWPDADPLGQILSMGGGRGGGQSQVIVIGIARDFVFGSLSQPATGVIVTLRQGISAAAGSTARFAIRGRSPESMTGSIQRLVKDTVPNATLLKIETGREIVARDLGRQRLGAWFFSGFGLAALVLGVGGVFGLVAYMAESRRREFAVRLALGATQRDLVLHGLHAALVPVAFGVIFGLIVAALVARMFTSLLTGLSALDPLTYATVAMTMLGCAALAGLGAAWRLRRMMPTDALRTE
jgi:predicted permease